MDLQVKEQQAGVIETGTFANKQGESLAYSWLTPKDYDPSKKYPLVLFLHGAGERGDDGQSHVRVNGCDKFASPEFMEEYPCFVLFNSLQCASFSKGNHRSTARHSFNRNNSKILLARKYKCLSFRIIVSKLGIIYPSK